MDRVALDAELTRDEGSKPFAYDDANDAPIKAGVTVKGTITGGVGCNLEFLYAEEITFLLHNRQDRAIADLSAKITWFSGLDDIRQRSLVNLYFNVPAFVHWPRFMGFAASGNWPAAADELESTQPWISEVGARGHRIAAMLRTGQVAGLS